MPVATLNNVATQNVYTDALTVNFPRGRQSFTLTVFNASAFYRLLFLPSDGQQSDPQPEPSEHMIPPAFSNFRDVIGEGGPPGSLFGGIQLRSAVLNTPARVTVA